MNKLKENQAIILKGVGGQYLLHRYHPFFEGIATPRGIFRKHDISPLPGDIVEFSSSGDPDIPYVIDNILPRKNQLKRPPMTNLDVLLITLSTHLPEPDLFLIDRLLSYSEMIKIEPILLLTKTDLTDAEKLVEKDLFENYQPAKYQILRFGHDEDDLTLLKEIIKGKVVAFAGQSGVGKSTLINRLFDETKMLTGKLSEKAGRGKQTTRHIELFPYAESYVADTPGFQTVDFEQLNIKPQDFANSYPEIAKLSTQCKFNNCTHEHEPKCAVLNAERSMIHPERLKRYQVLRKEIENNNKF